MYIHVCSICKPTGGRLMIIVSVLGRMAFAGGSNLRDNDAAIFFASETCRFPTVSLHKYVVHRSEFY